MRARLTHSMRTGFQLVAWAKAYGSRTGLNPRGRRLYQDWEVGIVRQLYPDWAALERSLPHRTRSSLQTEVYRLDLPRLHGRAFMYLDFRRKRVLRRIYETMDDASLAAVLGPNLRRLKNAAIRNGWRRLRRPFKESGLVEIDNLLRRCFANSVSLVEIDEWAESGFYFSRRKWRFGKSLRYDFIDRAHRLLTDYEATGDEPRSY